MALKKRLSDVVPPHLINYIPTSFEIIGSRNGAVAIVEIPPELEEFKYEVAKAITEANKHVHTVLRKVGGGRANIDFTTLKFWSRAPQRFYIKNTATTSR